MDGEIGGADIWIIRVEEFDLVGDCHTRIWKGNPSFQIRVRKDMWKS